MLGKQLRFQSLFAARKRGSPVLVAKDDNPDSGQSGGRMGDEKERRSFGCRRRRSASNMQLNVG